VASGITTCCLLLLAALVPALLILLRSPLYSASCPTALQYVLPTDAPHLAEKGAITAFAMSPLLWQQHSPDCFDTYSAGVVLMQLRWARTQMAGLWLLQGHAAGCGTMVPAGCCFNTHVSRCHICPCPLPACPLPALPACSLPFLRTTSALRTFNGALARCQHDLEEWRARLACSSIELA
jgi:hypothetical protein